MNASEKVPKQSSRTEVLLSCKSCRRRKLKCDREVPTCSRCMLSQTTCVYPQERKQHLGRRETVQELREEIAQLRHMLSMKDGAQSSTVPSSHTEASASESVDRWDVTEFMDLGQPPLQGTTGDPSSHTNVSTSNDLSEWNFSGFTDLGQPLHHDTASDPLLPIPGSFQASRPANELVDLGITEQLPSAQLVEKLTNVYFETIHDKAPMLHRYRYMTSLHSPHHMQPPMCLQYIVMALSSSADDLYRHLAMPFYLRSKAYAASDELRDNGQDSVTVDHVQFWLLATIFECQQTAFARAAPSLAHAVRLAQVLGLHQMNLPSAGRRFSLPSTNDFSEMEERRWTWWAVYCLDQFVSSITAWPAFINDQHVYTHLPASDLAFEIGSKEETETLYCTIRDIDREQNYSPYAGKVLALHMLHRTLEHTTANVPDDDPKDERNGFYWTQHRRIDGDLSGLFMSLPYELRLPRNIRNINAVTVNTAINLATICLHQAAISMIQKLDLRKSMVIQCQARVLPAADDILCTLRSTPGIYLALKDPLIAFATYKAGTIYLEDFIAEQSHQSEDNLNFILRTMVAMSQSNILVKSFLVRLTLEMRKVGFRSPMDEILLELLIDTDHRPDHY